jgi:hypothetical protein
MELLIIGLGLALGVAGWIAGFVRAVRRASAPINDRLKTYCERQ